MLINTRNGALIAKRVEFATTFKARLKGLMGRAVLPPQTAMVLYPCSSVHTFFMRFPIDVIFLGADFKVLKIIENLPPRRVTGIINRARLVVELPAGTVKVTGTQRGHYLKFDLRGELHEAW